ncbi:nitrate- and nitrite sensing domain-containing protein [Streptomyces sp. BI20]|uniref:sensor histidine kinase n=1 Tax=Streptomyces sp. BI20 TaxID=3403460 RepID=UPI003C78880D
MRAPRSTPDASTGGRAAAGGRSGRGRRAHARPTAEDPARTGAGPAPAVGGGRPPGTTPAAPGGNSARRFAPRGPRTVRAKILALLMVPVFSLLALWAFTAVDTARELARSAHARHVRDTLRTPLAEAVDALRDERALLVRQSATGPTGAAGERLVLAAPARRSTAAVDALRLDDRHTVADAGDQPAEVADAVRAFVTTAGDLAAPRADAAAGRLTPQRALTAWSRALDRALAVEDALSAPGVAAAPAEARVLYDLSRASELLARENDLLALPADHDPAALRRLTAAVETRRALLAAGSALPDADRARWRALTTGPAHTALLAAEDRALADRAGAPAAGAARAVSSPPPGWEAAQSRVAAELDALRDTAAAHAARRADPLVGGLPAGTPLLVAGFAAIVASLVISVRIGRTLVVELVALRNRALRIAHRDLPAAMERLRTGQGIDLAPEPAPAAPAEDEIAQVGDALATVHRAALGAAAERAELAEGVSGVFVNLARRSQALVHRQLNLLDSMERRAEDPDELGDLFRLDHLTTRMRRHAESLIILSGAAPGRAWRSPVELTDVIRAAVSEIEDYPRVDVVRTVPTRVAGTAVADLTHLLAELLENAAQFSPPHTRVRVTGEAVAAGLALEIEDRGLGMGRERLDAANRRIVQSEDLDLFDSDRLGLFVAGRLAVRHGIRVHLRPSPYGGTTAVVLLPGGLLHPASETEAGTGADPGAPGAPRATPPAPGGVDASAHGLRGATVTTLRARPRTVPGPRTEPGPRTDPECDPGPRPRAPRDPRTPPVATPAPAPTPAPPAPAPSVSLPAPAGPAGTPEGLPRRVRRAGLAPQLRSLPDPSTGLHRPPDPSAAGDPEQVRDRMAAYRDGWRRGAGEPAAPTDPPEDQGAPR